MPDAINVCITKKKELGYSTSELTEKNDKDAGL